MSKAEECDRRAKAAPDPDVRAQFAELAKQWRELANDAKNVEAMQQRLRQPLGQQESD